MVHKFEPQGLANVVWAWARLGHTPSPEVLDALATKLQQQQRRHLAAEGTPAHHSVVAIQVRGLHLKIYKIK